MPEIVIRVSVPDELAPLFVGRDIMVTPLSESEAEAFGLALDQVHERFRYLLRYEATPSQTEWNELKKFFSDGEKQMDFIRSILGRSARVGQNPTEGRLQ